MTNEIVEKIEKISIKNELEESHVQHLFTLSRKLIERIPKSDRHHYSLLKFYCDWTLHSKVDRSEEGALVLLRIHMIVFDNLKTHDNSKMAQDLGLALSLNETRLQLNHLISQSGGGSDIFGVDKWDEVIPILMEIIFHCSLKVGNDSRFSQIHQAIQATPLKGTSVVEELSIIKMPNIPAFNQREGFTYCLLILTTDTTKIIAPLLTIFVDISS
jgi:hypothetical protein